MELYLFKNDLTKEFRTDEKLCMWRRDGASLLQKYMVVSDESQSGDIIFKASSVYSCWEEKRKNDFFQIKVQLIGDKKEGKVKVVDIPEFEKYSVEDRPKVREYIFFVLIFSIFLASIHFFVVEINQLDFLLQFFRSTLHRKVPRVGKIMKKAQR